MKVCHVVGSIRVPFDEGTSKSVVKITEKMAEKGHEAVILTRPNPKIKEIQKLQDLEIIEQDLSLKNFFNIKKKLKELNPDIVHVHTSNPLMALYISKTHKRTVWTAPSFRGTKKTVKMWKYLSKNQKVLATSKKVGKKIPGEVEVVPYGIDTEKYSCTRKPELKEDLKIMFMSSPKEKRGFFAAIKIVKEMSEEKSPKFRVAVRDKKNRVKKAEKIIEKEGLSEITEVTGFVENLPEYFNEVDIVLYPVKSSSGMTSPPLITLEAMSCGRITVCTDVKDFQEVIEDDKDGILYSYGEEEKVAERILSLTEEKVEKISEKAQEKIYREYSLDNTVDRYFESYRELMN